MKRSKLKSMIDDLMGQYDREEIDGDTYMRKMMNLTTSARDSDDDDDDDDDDEN